MAAEKANEKEAACVVALKKEFPPSVLDADDQGYLSDSTYLRFARARDGNVEKATAMLDAAIKWRKEAKPYAVRPQDVQKAMEQVTMVCGGRDKLGCPIIAMELGNKNDCSVEERTNQLIYILEETERKGYERITWIVDFVSMGKSRDERSRETRKKTSKILQDYYPERVALILIYRPPWYISWLLGLAKAFMDPRTAAKVHHAGSTVEELEKYIARDQVPKICGGDLEGTTMDQLSNLPSLNDGAPNGKVAALEAADANNRPVEATA